MHLSGLHLYPVKSLRGIPVVSAELDPLGLVGDRRFLVIDAQGKTMTQRGVPTMALVETELVPGHLNLTLAGASRLSVPLRAVGTAEPVTVSVWSSEGLIAEDCGRDAAAWLTSALRVECRLVRIGRDFRRPILDSARASATDLVSFADGYPFLLANESSVSDLNQRLVAAQESPVPINRFRANFAVTGSTAFAEDTWQRLQIGEVVFRSGGPCSRCTVTTTDQSTGTRGKEPLATLATFRRDAREPGAVNFGLNLIHETKSGTIKIGDSVLLL
jgi:uncharacterized protein YcbX